VRENRTKGILLESRTVSAAVCFISSFH